MNPAGLRKSVIRWTLFLIPVAILMSWLGPGKPKRLPDEWNSPILAYEMAESAEQAHRITGPKGSGIWTGMKRSVWLDFLFLVGYGIVFVRIGQLVILRGGAPCRWLGKIAMAAAVATMISDVAENAGILTMLNGNDSWLGWMRTWSAVKWSFYGVTCLMVSNAFWPKLPQDSAIKLIGTLIAWLYLVAGLTALYGALARPLVLEKCVLPVTVAFVAQAWMFWRYGSDFDATL